MICCLLIPGSWRAWEWNCHQLEPRVELSKRFEVRTLDSAHISILHCVMKHGPLAKIKKF